MSRRKPRTEVPGTCYLLCIRPRYKHAGHYLGWTEGPAQDRVLTHLTGHGSPLIRAALAAGCAVGLARVWENVTRSFERRMKNAAHIPFACPCCRGEKAHRRYPLS